jgi:O-antigen/teichoic acid export membrane protein
MLLRHGAMYLVARGLPGLVSLAAISIYSRLLSPDDYGQYALVVAGVGLANKLVFEWLRLALLRFLPSYQAQRATFVSTLLAGFLGLAIVSTLFGGVALLALTDPAWLKLAALGLPLLWVQALFDLHLELARSQLSPVTYGLMSVTKAVLALALGVALVLAGLGPVALLCGLLFGMLVPLLPPFVRELRAARAALVDRQLLISLSRYGGPLAVTAALGFIIANSDRFMIAWLLGDGAVGRYAVSYDFASNAINIVLIVVNLASYPIVVRALERDGPEAARRQLLQSLTALAAVGLPATAGLIVVAPNAVAVLLGDRFQEDAADLIRWIAVGALLNQLRAFYLNLAFQLARYTVGQMWISVAAAGLNVILNLWWIPAAGIKGAAYATVVSYAFSALLTGILGRGGFRLPAPDRNTAKIAFATLVMAMAVWLISGRHGMIALGMQIGLGGFVYLVLLWMMDVAGLRSRILSRSNV